MRITFEGSRASVRAGKWMAFVLTSCDTFLAGCISYFVENGTLDPERTNVVNHPHTSAFFLLKARR